MEMPLVSPEVISAFKADSNKETEVEDHWADWLNKSSMRMAQENPFLAIAMGDLITLMKDAHKKDPAKHTAAAFAEAMVLVMNMVYHLIRSQAEVDGLEEMVK